MTSLYVKEGSSLRVGGFKTNQATDLVTGYFDDQDIILSSGAKEITQANFSVQVDKLILENGATLATRLNGSTMGNDPGISKEFHINELTVDLTANDSTNAATIKTNGPLKVDTISVLTDDLNKKFVVTNDVENREIINGKGEVKPNANALTDEQMIEAAKIAEDSKVSVSASGAVNDGSMSSSELLSKVAGTIDLGRTELAESNLVDISVEENEIQGALSAKAEWNPNATDGEKITIDSSTISQAANEKTTGIGEIGVVSLMQWRAEINDMQSRLGDLRQSANDNGLWVRTYGGKTEYGTQDVDMKYKSLQMGYDRSIAVDNGQVFLGGALNYTGMDTAFAKGDGEGYTFAFTGYGSWLLDSGLFVDVTAKYGTLSNKFDMKSTPVPYTGEFDTHFISMTAEVGKRFALPENFYLEPQVEFMAGHVYGENYQTSHGMNIKQDSFNSLIGRVGVQGGWTFPNNNGSIYARASYLYDWDAEMKTSFSMANNGTGTYKNDLGGGWYELAIGTQYKFSDNFYGFADFECGAGGDLDTPYRWNVGLRLNF